MSAATESEQGFHQYDFKLSEAKVVPGIIKNSRQTRTIVFRCPVNGHYYVAFNFQIFLRLSVIGWVLSKIAICYQLQHAQTYFSLSSETVYFRLFLKAMKNLRRCPQLIMSTQPKISRQTETAIWLIHPACLTTVKVNMSRKTTMLFRVLQNRWSGVNELVLFYRTV